MRLEEILRERNLTKKAFCDMLNMLPQNLNSSMKNPTVTTLEKWASALDIPIWQLFVTKEDIIKDGSGNNVSTMRVKELLKEKGMTAKELAKKMGVSEGALSKSLSGNPTIGTLEKIASALGVTIQELFEPPKGGVITCPNCGKPITLHPTCED